MKARTFSGFVPAHTGVVAAALADLSIEAAVAIADSTEVAPDVSGPVPAYEVWRQRIRGHFEPAGEALAS